MKFEYTFSNVLRFAIAFKVKLEKSNVEKLETSRI